MSHKQTLAHWKHAPKLILLLVTGLVLLTFAAFYLSLNKADVVTGSIPPSTTNVSADPFMEWSQQNRYCQTQWSPHTLDIVDWYATSTGHQLAENAITIHYSEKFRQCVATFALPSSGTTSANPQNTFAVVTLPQHVIVAEISNPDISSDNDLLYNNRADIIDGKHALRDMLQGLE